MRYPDGGKMVVTPDGDVISGPDGEVLMFIRNGVVHSVGRESAPRLPAEQDGQAHD